MRRYRRARAAFAVERIELAHGTVEYRRSTRPPANERPALVLVPGAGLSGRYLLPLADLLAHDFPVWVPDPPGFGRSATPPSGATVPAIAGALADWMSAVRIERAVVVGNSMGCQIATELSVLHPERVLALVLQGQTVDPAARTPARQAARVVIDAFREPISLWFLQATDWVRTGLRRAGAAIHAMFEFRIEDRLPLVRCPVLVVSATRDAIAPSRWSQHVHRLLADSTLVEAPGAAHAMPYHDPAALAGAVRRFAARWQEDRGAMDHKRVVEQYFEGFRRSDHDMVLACLTDDVIWDLPGFKHLAGKDAFDGEIENDEFVGSPTLVVDRLVEDGDTVVAIGTGEGTHRSGDVRRFAYSDVFTFRGDRISRVESYLVPLQSPAH